jgi:predicted kinase
MSSHGPPSSAAAAAAGGGGIALIVCGLPAAGKSTLCSAFRDRGDVLVFESDDALRRLVDTRGVAAAAKAAREAAVDSVAAHRSGLIAVEGTMLRRSQRLAVLRAAAAAGHKAVLVWVHADASSRADRDRRRGDRSVGSDVLCSAMRRCDVPSDLRDLSSCGPAAPSDWSTLTLRRMCDAAVLVDTDRVSLDELPAAAAAIISIASSMPYLRVEADSSECESGGSGDEAEEAAEPSSRLSEVVHRVDVATRKMLAPLAMKCEKTTAKELNEWRRDFIEALRGKSACDEEARSLLLSGASESLCELWCRRAEKRMV